MCLSLSVRWVRMHQLHKYRHTLIQNFQVRFLFNFTESLQPRERERKKLNKTDSSVIRLEGKSLTMILLNKALIFQKDLAH